MAIMPIPGIKDNRDKHEELKNEPIPIEDDDRGRSLLQDDALYPSDDWDIDHFKKLRTFKQRVDYAKEKLGKLGAGSARIVFEIDKDTVLKLARNKKGLAQNGLEKDISDMGYDFLTRVYESDPNNLWIEAEKAKPMTESDFRRLSGGGFDFDDWTQTLFYVQEIRLFPKKKYRLFEPPLNFNEIEESRLFKEIWAFIKDYDIQIGDFRRISSWGVVSRNGKKMPVLIDYGVSRKIYQDLYVKKR